jgi:hypothetical protein
MEKINEEEQNGNVVIKHLSSKQLVVRRLPLASTLFYSRLMFKCSMTSSSFIILIIFIAETPGSTPSFSIMDECLHIFHTHIARNIGKAKTTSLPANGYSSIQADLQTKIKTEELMKESGEIID